MVRLLLARFAADTRGQWLREAGVLLSDEELAHAASFSNPDAQARHVIGRALLRLLAAEASGRRPAKGLAVAVSASGKPWLPELPDLYVSLAHTGCVVIAAASEAAPVGVDIEQPPASVPEPRRIAARMFSPVELESQCELPDQAFSNWFTDVWTIKEAVGKALGVGVVQALSQVSVRTAGADLCLGSVGFGPPSARWTLHRLVAPGGCEKVAVALPAPGVALAPVSPLTLPDLVRGLRDQGATERTCSGSAPLRARR